MPLSVDSFVQQSSGSFVGTSGNATLSATTAGNLVILILAQSGGLVTPAGFSVAKTLAFGSLPAGFYYKATAGGETSFAIAPSSSQICNWVVYEVAGLDALDPLDMSTALLPALGTGTGATLATGATPVAGTYDGLVITLHACLDTTSTTPGTWSGHTGGLTELTEQGGADGVKSLGLSVAYATSLSLAAWQCTATKTAPVGQAGTAGVVIFTAAGARRAADIACLTGFEFGTVLGLATGSVNNTDRIFDSLAGTPAIVTTSPRSGDYCLELSSSAAAESVTWGEAAPEQLGSISTQMPLRLSVYFPTSLPGADLELLKLTPATAADAVVLRYESSDSTLGLKLGTGTEVFSSQAVTANQWISIDLRVDGRTTAGKCDWRIDYLDDETYVDQTQATATITAVVSGWTLRLGWASSSTATVRYDDVVVGLVGGHYPLGNMKILAVTPDPAGTLLVGGSSANFQTFSNNGTLAAWDATVARDAIDERPPTIGATADGFAQIATATGDYVEIPMTTVNAANMGAAIRAVRMLACGWAASTTAATIGFRAYDGTTETQLIAGSGDKDFDNSTTNPLWSCKMVRGAGRFDWTQAKLDALAFRVGFSNDASPACGIHAIYGEVAFRIGDLVEVISVDGGFYVHWRMDPDSSGVIQAIITTPVDRGAFYSVTVSGTPIEVNVPPDTVHTEYIGATDISTVTEQTLIPGVG